ncbi:recombinase family protein [Streptomyces sp. NBC_00249]|uniref:recombinase family protein n=1 Tax=Streptomyces sp. NBC_00249 TaxID=2975690 RepID=UPI002258E7FC|nr:recombinase family protein [Streptomyces sp. NBC_00249]MCX5196157.1 recombinase family protein [Streptomyces sp. NBC_00249]
MRFTTWSVSASDPDTAAGATSSPVRVHLRGSTSSIFRSRTTGHRTLAQSEGVHQDAICDLYLRSSLDRDGKTAIERQEADCRAWAERNELTVRKVHMDRGRSGYKTVERKGFDAALAAITAGVVGTLVVWKLDRLSRKGIGQVGKVLDDIEKADGRLVSVVDDLDTSNDSARMVVAKLADLARSESENLGTRVSNAKLYLRSKGQWIGGQAPYGLRVDPKTKKLIRDPEHAVYARLIADEALAGTSLVKIARLLNEYEIPSPRGGQWNAASIMQLLRSPALAGLMPETETVATDDGERKYTGRVSRTAIPRRSTRSRSARGSSRSESVNGSSARWNPERSYTQESGGRSPKGRRCSQGSSTARFLAAVAGCTVWAAAISAWLAVRVISASERRHWRRRLTAT